MVTMQDRLDTLSNDIERCRARLERHSRPAGSINIAERSMKLSLTGTGCWHTVSK